MLGFEGNTIIYLPTTHAGGQSKKIIPYKKSLFSVSLSVKLWCFAFIGQYRDLHHYKVLSDMVTWNNIWGYSLDVQVGGKNSLFSRREENNNQTIVKHIHVS